MRFTVIPTESPDRRKWHRFESLLGKRINRLTVIQFDGFLGQHTAWLCVCACGGIKRVSSCNLKSGNVKSCGCLRADRLFKTHGHSDTPEYAVYQSAKARCTLPTVPNYHLYGGRGIEFRFDSFEAFITEIGFRPSPKHSLDRIDNDGHYEPKNIRWATGMEQSRNRRTNRLLEWRDKRATVAEWAQMVGLSSNTISTRLNRGWTIERTLTTPKRG